MTNVNIDGLIRALSKNRTPEASVAIDIIKGIQSENAELKAKLEKAIILQSATTPPDRQASYLVFSPVMYAGRFMDTKLHIPAFHTGSYCISNNADIKTGFYINSIYTPEVTHWAKLPDAELLEAAQAGGK